MGMVQQRKAKLAKLAPVKVSGNLSEPLTMVIEAGFGTRIALKGLSIDRVAGNLRTLAEHRADVAVNTEDPAVAAALGGMGLGVITESSSTINAEDPLKAWMTRHPKVRESLERILEPGESVEVVIAGAFNQFVVGTNRRVVVIKKGLMAGATFGGKLASWEHRTITGVQLDTHIATGVLIIRAAGEEPVNASYWAEGKGSPSHAPNAITFSKRPSQAVQDGVAKLRQLIAQAHQPVAAPESAAIADPLEQLKQLGALRDSGILTTEEFESKKAELLGRL